jgi:serine/threonine-protein kinase
MEITGILVMSADTELLPVDQLSDELRRQLKATTGDYAVTRPNSRTLARIINSDAARLVQEFRKPSTVVQAVLRYCRATKEDPESTLDAAFPVLERLVQARLLVSVDSQHAQRVRPTLETGSRFAGTEVVACLQALEDTDVYRVKYPNGETAALKLVRSASDSETNPKFDREALVLTHLDGAMTPTLLATGTEDELRYMLLSWCQGSDCSSIAAQLRSSGDFTGLLRLSLAILDAYAHLHARNVIHSDIHPGNILVDNDYSVRLVDFGLARIAGAESDLRNSPRAGVAYFFEPEYANSVRSGHRAPCSSMPGEQYSLAALLYLLITGRHSIDFSLEKHEMLRQISEDGPMPFGPRGIQPWPDVEEVLAKALAKDPANRFASVAAFAAALRSVEETPTAISAHSDPATYNTATKALTRVLNRLDSGGPLFQSGLGYAPRTSVTYGSAGIACGLHRIACARQDPKLLSLADLWSERAVREACRDDAWYCPEIEITPEVAGRISPYHTESGLHFVKALIAHSMGDVITQQKSVDSFIATVSRTSCRNLDLTLGRSGTLLAASHLLAALKSDSTADVAALRELGNNTLTSIWQQLDSYAPMPECREIGYSGIAHGWAGILYATLCWCHASGTALPRNLEERLNQLATLARYSGRQVRWSVVTDARGSSDTYMAGWCNGTAGQVHLWLSAHRALKNDPYLELAEKAGWHAAESDSGDGSLCCGFSGQAYALLSLYRSSGDRLWLQSAQRLGERAATACLDVRPGRDYEALALRSNSLYKGELGVAVLAADLESPSRSALPAFELIEF